MHKTLPAALTVLVVLVFGLLVGCGSSEPFTVNGTMDSVSSTPSGDTVSEGNTLTIAHTESDKIAGDLVGTNEVKYTAVIDRTTGEFTLEYDGTFTGNIGDESGTYTFHGVGSGQMSSGTAGTYTADETIISGTGDFENLTGTLKTEGKIAANGSTATYTGTYQYK